jgi:multidrug efflux pump subunit AcrB
MIIVLIYWQKSLTNEIEKVNDVAVTKTIGGRNRELRMVLQKDKLAAAGLDFLSVAQMIRANNQQLNAGNFNNNDQEFAVRTGDFLKSQKDVENLVVGVLQNQPIYLRQVANVIDGPEVPVTYVGLGFGKASEKSNEYRSEYPAVTISVAKRKGADAMKIQMLLFIKLNI